MSISRVIFGRLVAASVLSFVAVTGNAQDVLQIQSPPDGTEVWINESQEVTALWMRGTRPAAGREIEITTTFGDLSVETVTTDANGVAMFSISSAEVGDAEVAITGEDTTTGEEIGDDRTLHFIDPADSASPFGDLVTPENPNGLMKLLVFKDRIGFRGQPGVDINTVGELAAERDLVQEPPLDENLFVLRIKANVGRDALRALARDLEEDIDSGVLKAGLVAKLERKDQWLVVPDEIVLRFEADADGDSIGSVLGEFPDDDLAQSPVDERRYLVRLPTNSTEDVFQTTARLIASDGVVQYAEPNYMIALRPRSPAQEPGFAWQWTLEGNSDFGVDDADVDAYGAWDYSTGSSNTLIAILDRGFDIDHVDLQNNLWTGNAGQHGIDLVDSNDSDLLSTATSYIQYGHGTGVAGVAAADGANGAGYTGACAECQLLLIRKEADSNLVADAFNLAVSNGANVISNSWGFWGTYLPINTAIEDAVAEGVTVLFAMSNEDWDNCPEDLDPDLDWDLSSHHQVIAVSGVTDHDRRAAAFSEGKGYGNCMDIVAPTRGGDQGVSTTYVEYDSGPVQTYVSNFGGTSAATPLVAGIAGLMLDAANINLSPIQVQRILQDTADRVDPVAAKYSPEFGFSDPAGSPKYGYGRVNALEATRSVAPSSVVSDTHGAGRGGHDLLLRDHALDWGNTEKESTTIFSNPRMEVDKFKSVDIKIDVEPFQLQATTPAEFVALIHEEPEAGKRSRLYVRLRNRGPESVASADLKLIWSITGSDFPPLPSDFWTTFPDDHTDVTDWQPVPAWPATNIAYSGASLAGCPVRVVPECLPRAETQFDLAQIAMFTLAGMDWDPAANVGPTFFAVVDSAHDRAVGMQDPPNGSLQVLENVVTDNNATLWTVGSAYTLPVAGECDAQMQQFIIALIIIGILLLVYVIVIWVIGGTVPVWVYGLLILILIVLLTICVLYPGCMEAVLLQFGIYL